MSGCVAVLAREYRPGGVLVYPRPHAARAKDGGPPFCFYVDMVTCATCSLHTPDAEGWACCGTEPFRRGIR